MSQHEQYTVPPGFSVSGGSSGTKLAPILIDPTTPPSSGDTLVFSGTLWVPQVPGGPKVSPAITISSADLLALDTVRKQVLAAPGAGFVRLALWAAYRMVPGATPYTIDPGEGIAMRYGTGAATAGPFLDGELILAATAPTLSTLLGSGYQDLLSAFENQPTTLVATAPITAGNGHLVLTLSYQDVSVA
jgi:hypothetical protein